MSDLAYQQPPLYVGVGCALAVVFVPMAIYLAGKAAGEQQRRHAEAKAKQQVLSQLVEFRNGCVQSPPLFNTIAEGGFATLEVAHAKRISGIPRPYRLVVMFSHDVDDLLEAIAGQPGLVSLDLVGTDVSDAGLRSIATLPDLEEL